MEQMKLLANLLWANSPQGIEVSWRTSHLLGKMDGRLVLNWDIGSKEVFRLMYKFTPESLETTDLYELASSLAAVNGIAEQIMSYMVINDDMSEFYGDVEPIVFGYFEEGKFRISFALDSRELRLHIPPSLIDHVKRTSGEQQMEVIFNSAWMILAEDYYQSNGTYPSNEDDCFFNQNDDDSAYGV